MTDVAEPKKVSEPRKIVIELRGVRRSENEPIYSLDSIVDSQIADLQKRMATGDFDNRDFNRLSELISMKEKLFGMKNEAKTNTSELDGKTQEEIEALVIEALDKIKNT